MGNKYVHKEKDLPNPLKYNAHEAKDKVKYRTDTLGTINDPWPKVLVHPDGSVSIMKRPGYTQQVTRVVYNPWARLTEKKPPVPKQSLLKKRQ